MPLRTIEKTIAQCLETFSRKSKTSLANDILVHIKICISKIGAMEIFWTFSRGF